MIIRTGNALKSKSWRTSAVVIGIKAAKIITAATNAAMTVAGRELVFGKQFVSFFNRVRTLAPLTAQYIAYIKASERIRDTIAFKSVKNNEDNVENGLSRSQSSRL